MADVPKKRGRPRKADISDDQVKTIVKEKRKRNRPDLANYGQEFIEPGDNRKYITFAMESRLMPKLDFDDLQAVQERIDWYFMRCSEADMKPGVVGLANALGIDRKTLWAWKEGTRRPDNHQLSELIKRAYSLLEEMWETYMQNGKISPPNGIFLGKNHFGYKDVQDVVVQQNDPYADMKADEVKTKYLEDLNDIKGDGEVK